MSCKRKRYFKPVSISELIELGVIQGRSFIPKKHQDSQLYVRINQDKSIYKRTSSRYYTVKDIVSPDIIVIDGKYFIMID